MRRPSRIIARRKHASCLYHYERSIRPADFVGPQGASCRKTGANHAHEVCLADAFEFRVGTVGRRHRVFDGRANVRYGPAGTRRRSPAWRRCSVPAVRETSRKGVFFWRQPLPDIWAIRHRYCPHVRTPTRRHLGGVSAIRRGGCAIARRCAREYRGNPWAILAQRELDFAIRLAARQQSLRPTGRGPSSRPSPYKV